MPILRTVHLCKGLTSHVYCTTALYEFKLKVKRFKCRKVKGLDLKLLIIYSGRVVPSTHYWVACAQQTLFKQTILHPTITSSKHYNLFKEFSQQCVESIQASMSRRQSLVNKESIKCDSSTNSKFIKLQIYYNKCIKKSNVQDQKNGSVCKNCYGARQHAKFYSQDPSQGGKRELVPQYHLWPPLVYCGTQAPSQLASHTIN